MIITYFIFFLFYTSFALSSFFHHIFIHSTVACLFQSSWFTSLPYLGQWVFASIYGTFADTLLKRKKMSLLGVRRLSTIVCECLVFW
jgi:MFS family permease